MSANHAGLWRDQPRGKRECFGHLLRAGRVSKTVIQHHDWGAVIISETQQNGSLTGVAWSVQP
jgi:hypothetical protein